MPKKTTTQKLKRADYYDEGDFNYLHYWRGRDYEHAAEELAIRRLLKGKKFQNAADIGGGYGRLCLLLKQYAEKVTLVEPSETQIHLADEYLKDHPEIDRKLMQADSMNFKDKTFDLLTFIRVMHHLPDPSAELKELARILKDDGYLILEMANYAHGRNRVKLALSGKKLPKEPVDIRSEENRNDNEIPFVNHNPKTVVNQLAHAGLKVEKVLSVSNLRSPGLKKVVPRGVMIALENLLQPTLAKTYFGPSVFFLVRKAK